MLEPQVADQIGELFTKVTVPVELVASLGDGEDSAKLAQLLDTLAGLSDLVTVRHDGTAQRRPSFAVLDPAVVVLDEATADLDLTSVTATDAALRAALAGRTTITIAHRLTVAEGADRVLVLDDGAVIEDGHHDELIARPDGHYAELWRIRQAGRPTDHR